MRIIVRRLLAALSGVLIGAAALTACAPPSPAPTTHTSAKKQMPGLPAELAGRWCPQSSATHCFNGDDILRQHPHAFVADSAAWDAPGTTEYVICFEANLGSRECSMDRTELIAYFPPGVGWNCVQVEVVGKHWPACDPDQTATHNSSQPRVVILPNHQMNPNFLDSPALYRTP